MAKLSKKKGGVRYTVDFHTGQVLTVDVRPEGKGWEAKIVKPDLSYFSGRGATPESALHAVINGAMNMGDLPRPSRKRTRKNSRRASKRRTSKRKR